MQHRIKFTVFLLFMLFAASSCENEKAANTVLRSVDPIEKEFEISDKNTLTLIKTIDFLGDRPLGRVTGVANNENHVFIIDNAEGHVHVLKRQNLDYGFTIGEGTGKGPSNLNAPDGLFFWDGHIAVSQSRGGFAYSFFDLEGNFVKVVSREKILGNTSFDKSLTRIGGYIFKTVGQGVEGKKVERIALDSLGHPGKMMVETMGFGCLGDTSKLNFIHPFLFISPYPTQDNYIRIAAGADITVNDYDINGVLKESHRLGAIPELNTYMFQLDQVFDALGGEKTKVKKNALDFFTNYFEGVGFDNENRLVYPIYQIDDLDRVLTDITNPDTSLIQYAMVIVDLKKSTYGLYYTPKHLIPLRIIDGNLWCFNPKESVVEVYKIP